jgi:hypothetical protein
MEVNLIKLTEDYFYELHNVLVKEKNQVLSTISVATTKNSAFNLK